MNPKPKLRSPLDRARQVIAFEVGGLILVTPPFAWASGVPAKESFALMALMALIAALWNAVYTTFFDWLEGRWSNRSADRRSKPWRVVHAMGFEAGLLLISLPIVMAITAMSWRQALLADVALAAAYVAYAFVFNLAYDRAFPISGQYPPSVAAKG